MFFWICSTDGRFNGFRETYVFGAAFQSSALPLSTPDRLGHLTFRVVGENVLPSALISAARTEWGMSGLNTLIFLP